MRTLADPTFGVARRHETDAFLPGRAGIAARSAAVAGESGDAFV
jgi:hypothetical protein